MMVSVGRKKIDQQTMGSPDRTLGNSSGATLSGRLTVRINYSRLHNFVKLNFFARVTT